MGGKTKIDTAQCATRAVAFEAAEPKPSLVGGRVARSDEAPASASCSINTGSVVIDIPVASPCIVDPKEAHHAANDGWICPIPYTTPQHD